MGGNVELVPICWRWECFLATAIFEHHAKLLKNKMFVKATQIRANSAFPPLRWIFFMWAAASILSSTINLFIGNQKKNKLLTRLFIFLLCVSMMIDHHRQCTRGSRFYQWIFSCYWIRLKMCKCVHERAKKCCSVWRKPNKLPSHMYCTHRNGFIKWLGMDTESGWNSSFAIFPILSWSSSFHRNNE